MTEPFEEESPEGKVVDGDPFGGIKQEAGSQAPEPRTVSWFHTRDDVDSGQTAHHHTIGIKHDQAAAGDHTHDGKGTRKVGEGLALTVSGSRGGNAALASLLSMLQNVITFTDNTTA